MTPQEVIQKFVAEINANKYSNAVANVGTSILDDAVRASTKFANTQEVIDAMKADQVAAEKLAVEEVLGSKYKGQTMSQISDTVLNVNATGTQKSKSSNGDATMTVRELIRELKANIFLQDYCGIELNDKFYLSNGVKNAGASDNEDTGAITGSDANLRLAVGDVVNGETLTSAKLSELSHKYGPGRSRSEPDALNVGSGWLMTPNTILYGYGAPNITDTTSYTTDGLTIKVGDGTQAAYNALTDDQKNVVASLYTWWTKGTLELNQRSYDLGFTNAKIKEITLTFDNTLDSSTLATVTPTYRIDDKGNGDGTVTALNLKINSTATTSTDGLNRAIANELSRAVIAANVNNFNKLPQFVKEGLAEITHGIDDEQGQRIFTAAYNENSLSSALSLEVTKNNMDKPSAYTYPGGYMFMRYLSKKGAEQTLEDDIFLSDVNANVDLSLGKGTYYVSGSDSVDTASTTPGAVSLGVASDIVYTINDDTPVKQIINIGNTAKKVAGINSNTSVFGGTGNDTLEIKEGTFVNAGDGNNSISVDSQYSTVKAGDGADSVTINGGGFNDINLGDGNNRISLTAADYNHTLTTGMGDDTIVDANNTIHSNHLIDTGAGSDLISLVARDGTISAGEGNDRVSFRTASGTGNFVDLGSGNDTVPFAGRNNTIVGTGNNVISSTGGGNVFMFTEGNTTLKDFKSNDKLAVDGEYTVTKQGSNYVITTDTASINVAGTNFNSLTSIITPPKGVTIDNTTTDTVLSGSNYDDSIKNTGANVYINTGTGDDYVFENGYNNSWQGQQTTIDTGTGNDTVELYGGINVSLNAGSGDDSIKNGSQYTTINAGDGNNFIQNEHGLNVVITSGTGDDTIRNLFAGEISINSGAGNDIIHNDGTSSSIDAGDGDDSIYSTNSVSKLRGGDGNDTITNTGSSVSINAGKGDDSIINRQGSYGYGGDYGLFEYTDGDGNDTIVGFTATSTLSIAGAAYSSVASGRDILVKVGNGSVLLKNAASLPTVNIDGTLTADTTPADTTPADTTPGVNIDNEKLNGIPAGNTLISGTANNDSITNRGYYVTINAGAGSDTIHNRGNHVTIDAGAGNDSIQNYYSVEESINAGAGDDRIYLSGTSYSTIDMGAGNDTIENAYGNNYNRYNGGAGDDYISMYNNGVVSYGGDHNTINGGKGNDTINIGSTTGNKSTNTVIEYAEGDGDDVIYDRSFKSNYQIKLTKGTLTETLKSGSDIILKVGNGSLTLRNAAYSYDLSVNQNKNVIDVNYKNATDDPTVVTATEATVISDETDRPHMLINGSSANDKLYNYNDENTINGNAGDDWIWGTGGHRNQLNGGAGNDSININAGGQQNTVDAGDGDDSIYSGGGEASLNGGAGNDTIKTWYGAYVTINAGDGHDLIENDGSNDVTINAGNGNDKIRLRGSSYDRTKNNLIQYTAGEGDDTVWGFNATDTLQISGSTYTSARTGNGVLFTMDNDNGSVLLVDAAKYMPLNVTDGKPINHNVTLGNGNETYNFNASNASVVGGTGNDKIKTIGENVTVKPGPGDDTVVSEQPVTVGHGKGDGNDTIVAGADVNVNLTGGTLGSTGKSGDDIVLSVGTESITVKDMPDDAQLTVTDSTGTKTVKAAQNPEDTIEPDTTPTDDPNIITLTEMVDTYINGTEGVSIRALDGNDTLTNTAANVSVDGMGGDDKILNSFVPNVTLNGGKGDDFLANYGESASMNGGVGNDEIYNFNSNVTINGGKGDDRISLYSGAEGNIFQYNAANSEGNDTVWGFTSEDSLVIDETDTFASLRQNNDLLINVDNGSILLIDFFGDGRGKGSGNGSSGSGSGGSPTGGNLANISVPASAKDTTAAPLTAELTPENDIYTNRRDNVTLDAMTGDDQLVNYGKNVSLDAGGGNDSVYNYGEASTILGNDGQDYIENQADGATLDGGADADSILNNGSNVTISGGLGNDSVTLSPDAKNVVLEYFSGDGDDTVWGFTPEDSLVAYGNSFNTVQSGNDIRVTVDGGTVLLIGAATLPAVNFGNEDPTVAPAEIVESTTPGAQETLKPNDTVAVAAPSVQVAPADDTQIIIGDSPKVSIIPASDEPLPTNVSVEADGPEAYIEIGPGGVVDIGGESSSVVAEGPVTVTSTAPSLSVSVEPVVLGEDETVPVAPVEIINLGPDPTITAEPSGEEPENSIPLPVSVDNKGDNPLIIGGPKDDTVKNEGPKPTINAGDGNDNGDNGGDNGSIDMGAGDDTVRNRGKSITVTGGRGNDSVLSEGDKTSIDAGKGNDTVRNRANEITVTGGEDDDLIINEDGASLVVAYTPADGNDTIIGFNETSTLSISGAPFNTIQNGEDIIVNVSDGENEGSITLVDAAPLLPSVNIANDSTPADPPTEVQLEDGGDSYTNKFKGITVTGGTGPDTIDNTADSVLAAGGNGNDTIKNKGNSVTITGDAGKDTLYSEGSDKVSIDGGDDDDSIYIMPVVDRAGTIPSSENTVTGGKGNDYIYDGGAKDSSVDGGEGKDNIVDAGKNNTLHGGEDDDRINLKPDSENAVIDYAPGDGNDTVYGFNPTSTLHIADDAPFSAETVDNNVVVSVGTGDSVGTVTLVDAASLEPVITGTNPVNPLYQKLTPYNDNYTNKVDNATLDAMTGNDTLNIYGNRVSLDAAGGNDIVTSYGNDVTIRGGKETNAKNGDIANFDGNGAGNDTITSNGDNAVLDGEDGDDQFISNGDNALIIGGLGNDSVTLAPDAKANIIEHISGDGNDTVWGFTPEDSLVAYGYEFSSVKTGNDILVSIDAGSVLLKDVGDLSKVPVAVAKPGETPSILPDTTPAASQENSVDGAQVDLSANDSVNNTGNRVVITGSDGNNGMDNEGDEVTMTGGGGSDTMNNTGDSVNADGGGGADNMNNNGGGWVTMTGGEGDDTIFSTPDESVSADNPSIDGGAGNDLIVTEGDKPTVSGGDGDDTVNVTGNDGSVDGGKGNDDITDKGKRITVTGNEGNDKINTTGDSVSAEGGKGDDTITAGGKYITLSGDEGSDEINLKPDAQAVIKYGPEDGDDTLNGFDGNDTLSIAGGFATSENDEGDIIVDVDDGGTITITDAASLPAPNIVQDLSGVTDKIFRFTEQADTYANNLEGATLLALAGDDKLDNFAPNVSINSYAGNNLINNRPNAANVTIETGDGNDSIYNWEGVTAAQVDAGNGDNYIYNDAANSKLKTGDGADKILNYKNAAGTAVDAGAGTDKINNSAANVTITAGKGNDSIYLTPDAKNNIIEYITGDGDDTVWGFTPEDSLVAFVNNKFNSVKSGNDILVTVDNGTITLKDVGDLKLGDVKVVTLEPGKTYEPTPAASLNNSVNNENQTLGANDSITNTGSDLSITGGTGGNGIDNTGKRVTITGSDGDDTINTGDSLKPNATNDSVIVDAGAGNDQITNKGRRVTLTGSDGNDTINNAGDSVVADGSAGDDSIVNTGKRVTLTGDDGNDTLNNLGDSVSASGGAGSDNLTNTGMRVTLTGDDGNDTLTNTGESVSANGGAGDDQLKNTGNYVTLTGDGGNDNLVNTGDSVNADGGTGDDTIQNDGNASTVKGGTGDDSIGNTGDDVQFDYTSGDGNDTVSGFKDNSTLSVAGGEVSSTKSGDDVIVNVDDGSITLTDAATLSTINIVMTEELPTTPADTTPSGKLIELTPEDDVYKNSDNNATVLALSGDDKLENYGTNVSIDGMEGKDTISNYADNVIVNGGDDADTLGNSGANVSISGGNDADYIINRASNVTINPGLGDDSIRNSAQNVMIDYMTGDGNDTVWGFDSTVTLWAFGYEFSSVKSGNDILFTVDDGTLVLKNTASIESDLNIVQTLPPDDDTTPPDTTPANKFIELTEEPDTYSNTLDGATISGLGGGDTLDNTANNVSISGGKGAESITSGGDYVTVNAGRGDDAVSVSGDDVVIQYQTGDGSDTIWGFKENSTLDINGSGIASVASGTDILFTLDGGSVLLKDVAELPTVNVETEEPAVNRMYVRLTNFPDYYENETANASIFALRATDTIVNSADEAFINLGPGNDLLDLTAGNDVTVETSHGDDTIKVGAGVTKLTITDFGSGDVIELPEAISSTEIKEDSLVAGNVTIGGINSEAIEFEEYHWAMNRGTAQYMKKDIVGGATLSADGKTIGFLQNNGYDQVVFSLKGVNPTLTAEQLEELIEITDDNEVILPDEVLAKNTIKMTTSRNYSLVLANEHPQTPVSAGWRYLDQTDSASLVSAGKSNSYYVQNAKTVVYLPYDLTVYASVGGVAANVSEEELAENLSFDSKTRTLTVKPAVVGENFSTDWNNKIVFANGTYTGSFKGSTGNDTVSVQGSGLTLDSGSGRDTIYSSSTGGNVYVQSAGSYDNVIVGFSSKDTIKITDNSTLSAEKRGNDVYLQIGRTSITLKDAINGTPIQVVDADNNALMNRRFYSDRVIEGDMIVLDYAYPDNYFTATTSIPNVSAENIFRFFTLVGGAEDNKFVGGVSYDWIAPGAGNNLLTGKTGGDTFAYGGGNDTITDYESGFDCLCLNAPWSSYEIKDDGTLVFKVNSGSVTILDALDKKINYFDGTEHKTEIFTKDGRFNTNKKSVILSPSSKEYTAENSIYTIDGSQANGVSITGNDRSNVIIGSSGSDTINGKNGSDTITGGAGKDVFVIEKGSTNIRDYSAEDKILISSPITHQEVRSKNTVYLLTEDRSEVYLPVLSENESIKVTFTDGANDTVRTFYRDKIVGSGATTLLGGFRGNYTAPTSAPVIDASAAGSSTLIGGNEDNTIIGSSGTDVIVGGGGKNILIGGYCADTFVHTTGNDVLSDYGFGGPDRISLSSAWSDVKFSGNDVILVFANNSSVTVPDRVDKEIYFMETNKNGGVNYSVNLFAQEGIFDGANKTAVTLDAATKTFNAESYSKLVTIDGGAVKSAAQIVGNAKANQIFAGTAGATLNGGKGNDSLWGSTGKDTFLYSNGDGRDVIFGYGNGDQLKIDGEFTAELSGKDVIFKVDSTTNAITLKDYTASTFNVNGDTYQISGSNFVKK